MARSYTDISLGILEHAVAALGLTLTTRELDGERLDVDPAAFGAVISPLGLITSPTRLLLAGQRRALRPGGRVSARLLNP